VRSCSVMYSAWRIASATIVSVGFAAAPLVNWPASDTNRFGTSCAWPKALTTPSRRRSLIRAVPSLPRASASIWRTTVSYASSGSASCGDIARDTRSVVSRAWSDSSVMAPPAGLCNA
jgi:hypothetical protein